MTYPSTVFEVRIRPTTWDGDDADQVIGLYYTMLAAETAGALAVLLTPYPHKIGQWEWLVREYPMETDLRRRP